MQQNLRDCHPSFCQVNLVYYPIHHISSPNHRHISFIAQHIATLNIKAMGVHQNQCGLASDKNSNTKEPVADEYSTIKRSLPSSQYKGVVPQPNGRWGAQIYEKHQRVWLGTFNLESEAARAYDVAAQRFRGRDAVTNFKPLSESDDSDVFELQFLDLHSKSDIVDMLRKHTYTDELLHNKMKSSRFKNKSGVKYMNSFIGLVKRKLLFEKTVTPSDVGKLNRLVIPKQHAENHFPMKGGNGILLNFEDRSGKVWRFRYSYWNSSQSYVLTKGWSRFVKEKGLQAGDAVSFHSYFMDGEEDRNEEKRLFIDCKHRIMQKLPHVVRLFGVDINSNAGDCWINSNGKRICGTVNSS